MLSCLIQTGRCCIFQTLEQADRRTAGTAQLELSLTEVPHADIPDRDIEVRVPSVQLGSYTEVVNGGCKFIPILLSLTGLVFRSRHLKLFQWK